MIKIFEKFNEPEVKIDYYPNGQKKYERWYLNGKLNREDGPAFQYWYRNGRKWVEKWWSNNKEHREDGPSHQMWFGNGQKEYERWLLNDKEYSREEWVEELKKIGSPHYEEQRMLLDMEKYNI